jgi:hypothetical protein
VRRDGVEIRQRTLDDAPQQRPRIFGGARVMLHQAQPRSGAGDQRHERARAGVGAFALANQLVERPADGAFDHQRSERLVDQQRTRHGVRAGHRRAQRHEYVVLVAGARARGAHRVRLGAMLFENDLAMIAELDHGDHRVEALGRPEHAQRFGVDLFPMQCGDDVVRGHAASSSSGARCRASRAIAIANPK